MEISHLEGGAPLQDVSILQDWQGYIKWVLGALRPQHILEPRVWYFQCVDCHLVVKCFLTLLSSALPIIDWMKYSDVQGFFIISSFWQSVPKIKVRLTQSLLREGEKIALTDVMLDELDMRI